MYPRYRVDDFIGVTIGGAVQKAEGLVGNIHHSPGVVFILKKKTGTTDHQLSHFQ